MISIPQYDLDWSSGRVYAKDMDRTIVERKFEMFNDFVRRVLSRVNNTEYNDLNTLDDIALGEVFSLLFREVVGEHLNSIERSELGQLLSDDTIYAYALLRWEGKPIRLRYYQDALLNDENKRIDAEASNQSGKSFSLCVKAAIGFLRNHGKNFTIGLISKSMAQNSMNMRMVRKLLKDTNVNYTPGSNDNMTVMVHEVDSSYTNTLVCSVASTSALGYPFDLELLDEFEFWENPEGLEYMYDQVLEPRTFHTRGQIIIYSNPNGKNFVSENLHKREVSGKFQFHVYNVNFLDVPGNTREEWDSKKSYTHPIMFASTMAALRTESEGSALTDGDIAAVKDEELDRLGFYGCKDKPSYWFLDIGFVNDQSCLAGCYLAKNDKDETVYNFAIKVYPRAYEHEAMWGREDGPEESVPGIVKQFGNEMERFELDLTGKEGNEVSANQAGLSCSGVKMSGPWKATWYERFITLVKQRRLKVQSVDNWIDRTNKNFDAQARTLKVTTKMPDGRSRPYPLYHHEKETDHDDILDAIVGCLSLVDEDMTAVPGISYIPGEKEQLAEQREKGKKKKIDDTPYDEEIEMAVEQGFRHHQMYGGLL